MARITNPRQLDYYSNVNGTDYKSAPAGFYIWIPSGEGRGVGLTEKVPFVHFHFALI